MTKGELIEKLRLTITPNETEVVVSVASGDEAQEPYIYSIDNLIEENDKIILTVWG